MGPELQPGAGSGKGRARIVLGGSFNGRIPALHAGDEGSIPSLSTMCPICKHADHSSYCTQETFSCGAERPCGCDNLTYEERYATRSFGPVSVAVTAPGRDPGEKRSTRTGPPEVASGGEA